MIGPLGDSGLLFGFFKDKTFELLSLDELILEPEFGAKQPEKNAKRDMIGVLKKQLLRERERKSIFDVCCFALISGNCEKVMYL